MISSHALVNTRTPFKSVPDIIIAPTIDESVFSEILLY